MEKKLLTYAGLQKLEAELQDLKVVKRKGNKYGFIIGALCIIFIMIESTTNSTFTKIYGETIMFLVGMIIAPTRNMTSEEIKTILKQPITK